MTDELLPPGPWSWQPTEGHGESLVAADGSVVLSSEGGHGWQEIHPAAKALLAQAWRLEVKADEPKKPLRSSYGKLRHLAADFEGVDIAAGRADLTEQADRAWNTPEDRTPTDWVEVAVVDGLMAEIKALKKELRDRRRRIFHCDLQQAWSGGRFWLDGPQVDGLAVGDALHVTDAHEAVGDATVFACEVASVEDRGAWVVEQPQPVRGITDYRVLHHVEPRGVRTYLILVVDGKASVVRLTIVLDRGQTFEEMGTVLDGVAKQWIDELQAMSPAEQRRFAELVDETSDPNMIQAQVLRERPQRPWYNCVVE